jgi:hypothetical protein
MPQVYNVGTRRLFVDAAAWCVIVGGALLAAAVISQRAEAAPQWMLAFAHGPLHAAGTVLMQHMGWANAALCAFVVLATASAVGVLRRHEWARRTFVGMAALALALLLALMWVHHDVVALAVHRAVAGAQLSSAALLLIDHLTAAARWLALALAACTGVLLLALIRALLSQEVRQEFA